MSIRPSCIIVPVALSPACEWAAKYGAELAQQFNSYVAFVHVGTTSPETVRAFLENALGQETAYELTICDGDPADLITQMSREHPSSWIVMGTHAHGRFRRFLLGSVTAKVLHDADCPVLTGVHRESMPLPAHACVRHILCAVDIGTGFREVIQGALEVKALTNSALSVVHAVPAVDEKSDNRGEIDVRHYLFGLATERFAELKRTIGIDVDIALAGGSVPTVVREAVLRTQADLVVIGRGHTQRSLGRLRTNAYGIIRSSPCPVLSV